MHSLVDLLRAAPPDQAEDLRRRLKVRLRQLVSEIVVLTVARGRMRLHAVQIRFRTTGQHRDYLILARPGHAPEVLSFADVAGSPDFDLRRPRDVKQFERLLADYEG